MQLYNNTENQKEAGFEMDLCKQSKSMADKDAFEFEMIDSEDDSMAWENMSTGSDENYSPEIIDITIEDARNKKITMTSTMDSVGGLMREVEETEKVAEEAVVEAGRTSLDILGMMDELKITKQRAMEINGIKEAAIEMDFCNQSDAMTDKDAFEFRKVNPEDNSTISENMIIRSHQIWRTEIIDITIEDAKNKKDTLNSTMDTVLSLLREVEHREKVAEEAVDKANRTSSYILAMIEEIKQAKQRTKEANEMHAQEVYAQKIAVATAMKELQFRVSGVLKEEDESLGDLDKMRVSLEKRLTAALEKKKATDKEEFEKIVALEYEKRLMRNIEEESKRLGQEAMEIIKMQEFIISRGHVVDMIQEDISCRFQHVNLLKEELIDCKDQNENSDNEKSLKDLEHREKVEQEVVEKISRTGLDIGAKMDEPKHAQQRAKVAEEAVAEAGGSRWDFFSKMNIPTHAQKSAEKAGEKAGRSGLDIFIKMEEPKHPQKNVAKEAVKKVSRTGLDIFSNKGEPKHAQKRAEEAVDEAGRTELDNLAKIDEPKPTKKCVNGKRDTDKEYFSLTPIIQETISGWDEKERISNQMIFRSRKSCKKDNKNIKRSETESKNKVMKKWIDGLIKEAVAEYEDDDFDRYERFFGF